MGPWPQNGTTTDREDLAYIRDQYGDLYRVTESPATRHAAWRAVDIRCGDVLTGDTGDALLWAIRRHYWQSRYGQ